MGEEKGAGTWGRDRDRYTDRETLRGNRTHTHKGRERDVGWPGAFLSAAHT